MADYAPPVGPPPPKVPEGWKAIWNTQYSEYFYVNIYTKQSQWDKPTEPVYPPGEAPTDAPPNYAPSGTTTESRPSMEKKNLGAASLASNNPYAASSGKASPAPPDISEDERLARQLQEEEDARARGHPAGGAANDYYAQGTPQPNAYAQPGPYGQSGFDGSPYPQAQSPYGAPPPPPAQDKGKSKGGFLGKLLGKAGGSSHAKPQAYPQQPGPYYGGQPGYGQQGYYPPQHGMMGQPHKRPGGGMGAGGAAALGVGGGLLGGALIGSALADAGDGGDFGGDGGDFGGGDFGGGDFGGGGF